MQRRLYIGLFCLMLAAVSVAAPRTANRSQLTHWIGVGVTGVEANMLPGGSEIKTRAGGGIQAHALYEMRKGSFFFNIGVGADYILTASWMSAYMDAFNRVDFTGEAMNYRYCYTDISEQQHQMRIVVPVQFGWQFGDWVYAGLGAAFRTKPLMNMFNLRSQMLTEGEYKRFIEPIRNAPDYGYWPQEEYAGQGNLLSAMNEIAVEAEAGVNIPLPSNKVRFRAGIYIGYDLPLGRYADRDALTLGDYSTVDVNPATQSLENLHANLRFHSMMDTPVAAHDAQRIRAGLRLTVLFDVTGHSEHCMCMP